MEVSVRNLNERLTGYLQRAHDGEHVIVTRHGKAFAEIGPPRGMSRREPRSLRALAGRVRSLADVTWSGRSLRAISKPAPLTGTGPTIAEMIIERRG